MTMPFVLGAFKREAEQAADESKYAKSGAQRDVYICGWSDGRTESRSTADLFMSFAPVYEEGFAAGTTARIENSR